MKDLRLECISDPVTKLGDTNTQFLFKAYNDLDRVNFTDNQAIVFHLDSADKRSIDGIVADGGESVGLSSASLKGLKPDTYKVEMWVTEGDKTDVYPTVGSLELTVNQNLVGDETVTVVSSLKVEDFERRFIELKQELKQEMKTEVAKLQGPPGQPGEPGKTGEPGDTPVIGEDGNWHIGGVNTELKAIGKDGVGTWDEIQKYIDGKTRQFLTTDRYKFDNEALTSNINKSLMETMSNVEDYVVEKMKALDSTKQELTTAVNQANNANSKASSLLASRQLIYNKDSHHFTANYGGRIDDSYYSIKLADNATLIVIHVDVSGFTYNSSNQWRVDVGTLTESLRPTLDDVIGSYFPYHNGGFRCSLNLNGHLVIDATSDMGASSGCHTSFMYIRKEG